MSDKLPKPKSTKTKPTAKATEAETIQRLSEVKSLLLQGKTRSDILEYAGKWAIERSRTDELIARATEQIQEIAQADTASDISVILRNLWDIINANKATNPQVARQALMDIAKLRGMDQTTVNHTFKRDEKLAALSEDEFDAAMQKAMESRH